MPIFAVDKPLGITSHDAVARSRRLLGTRKVGHAGTLDPLATGVLVLLSHEATKLSPFLSAGDKEYLAWVAFGLGTPTLDAEPPADPGALSRAEPRDLARLGAADVAPAAASFLRVTTQRPPAYSAVQRAGVRSYAAARSGAAEEPPARPVGYRQVELLGFAPRRAGLPNSFARVAEGWRPTPDRAGWTPTLPPELGELPTALIALKVAAGTYIRSFARDLGAALGVPAHLSGLVRTAAGAVDLTDCGGLDELATATPLDPAAVLPFPQLRLDAATAEAARHGKQLDLDIAGTTALFDETGALAAVVEPLGAGRMRYLRVWQRDLAP
ncbi:MAG: tRNA pseudouridine(55) synthase TruB [Trueperaceae bacterium]